MSEALKPCPYCGDDDVGHYEKFNEWEVCMVFCVCCTKCDAQSGFKTSKEKALDAWNKRTLEQPK